MHREFVDPKMLRLLFLPTLIVAVAVSAFGQIGSDSSKDDLHGPDRRVTKEYYLDFESGSKPAGKVETIYDRRGNTLVTVVQSTDGSIQKSEYEYTAAGKLRKMKFDPAGPEQAMYVYRYDRRGRLSREVALSTKGSAIYRTIYSYQRSGQVVIGKTF